MSDFAYQDEPTPIERHGSLWMKRDDLYRAAGAPGGKARTCWHLAQGAAALVTASSRASPQMGIVARIARHMQIPCRVHMPSGEVTPEMQEAIEMGAELVQHKAGYNIVIVARCREDAARSGYREIPFGMECEEAVKATASQVVTLPIGEFERIVMVVGSGMSLAGVLWGLNTLGARVPVLGVRVGADPIKRLDRYAPPMGPSTVTLRQSRLDYHTQATMRVVDGVQLDPVYEAKCIPELRDGDLFWIVGIRGFLSQ